MNGLDSLNKCFLNKFVFSVLVAMILISCPATKSFAGGFDETFQKDMQKYIQEEPILKGALTGISIRSARNGEVLFEYNGDVRMRPASNLKLLTTAVSLSIFGEDYRFKTEVRIKGEKSGTFLDGNLYLKGYGDPTLLKENLSQLAKDVRKSGITNIEGDLIADDSWFDDIRLSKDLVWSDESAYYGAQISALTVSPDDDYDTGTVLVTISSGNRVGEPAKIQVSNKTKNLKIINQVVTVSPDSEKELFIGREHGTNTIIIKGLLPLGVTAEKEWVAIWEPTQYVLELFREELVKQGINISGTSKIGKVPKDSNILTNHFSAPLSEILLPFLKLSNNGHGEMLVKQLGRVKKGEGSWEKGIEVMYEQLPKLGVDVKSLMIRDGSGISHVNLIPANELSSLLFHIQQEKWFPVFLESLPVAGYKEKMIGGTLRDRMGTLNIKAKTGTLTTVSSLCGYLKTEQGETVIFSILLNNLLDEEKGKQIEDEIVEIVSQHVNGSR